MKKKDMKEFKKLLKEERKKLFAKLNTDMETFDELQKEEVGDIIDKAFSMWEKDRALDVTEKDKMRLRQIEGALERIENGSYGVCTCGKEIAPKRLEFMPWTTHCIECERNKKK